MSSSPLGRAGNLASDESVRSHPPGALAVLEAEDLREADAVLKDAYRRRPQDPELVEAATRLAADAAPRW